MRTRFIVGLALAPTLVLALILALTGYWSKPQTASGQITPSRVVIGSDSETQAPLVISKNSAPVPTLPSGPDYLIDAVSKDGSHSRILLTTFSNGTGAWTQYAARGADGTPASPKAVPPNANIVSLSAFGFDGKAWSSARSSFQLTTAEAWAPGSHGMYARLLLAKPGTDTQSEAFNWSTTSDGARMTGRNGLTNPNAKLYLASYGTAQVVLEGGIQQNSRNITNGKKDVAGANDVTIKWKSGTAGAKTQIIPAATAENRGQLFIVKDGFGDAEKNNIVIKPESGTIDGAPSLALDTSRASVILQSDGNGDWTIISRLQ